jgi:serine/threonine protein kinase
MAEQSCSRYCHGDREMGATAAVHPSDHSLKLYGLGKLDDASADLVSKHLGSCPDCRRRVAEMSSDSFLGRLRDAQGLPAMSATDKSPAAGSEMDQRPPVAWSSPRADTLPPGLAANRDYEIVRELGRGGMGVVYLARNKLMGRLEVLKVVGGHLVERPGVRDRFLREVQSAAKLQHKNIVTAYSAMRLGESIALAMEYVEGDDLAKVVKSSGPMVVMNACYVIYQAAQGLQHAHERGMVHRDIKPANLILSSDGKKIVKVLDFGLAKVTSESHVDSGLTREGQMLGTPDYIAPEQIRNAQSADIRADIYSLGCTFYYLLAGVRPFHGDNLWDLYQAHFSMDASPLNLVRPEVPVELAALVAKMMAKEPDQRFQTPGEVARVLIPFLKRGRERSGSSSAGISQARDRQESAGEVCLSTSPAPRIATNRQTSLDSPAAHPRQESNWGSLIEIDETGSLTDAAKASTESVHPSRWIWTSAVAAIIVFALAAFWASRQFMFNGNAVLPDDGLNRVEQGAAQDRAASEASLSSTAKSPTEFGDSAQPSTRGTVPENREDLNRGVPAVDNHDQSSLVPRDQEVPPPPVPVIRREEPKTVDARKKGAVDIRQVISRPDIKRLADRDSVPPTAPFWPSLAPENLEEWQIADPAHTTMKEKGVYLGAGPNGNLLLTRDASYRRATLKLTLSVMPGTEAFVALRARRGADGWKGLTARVVQVGGKIHAGGQATDFQTQESGSVRDDIEPGKPFVMTFQIDERNVASVTVKGHKTSSATLEPASHDEDKGAVGLFVTSGTLIVNRMILE